MTYGSMTWMLQVGQSKGTECNEMVSIIIVTRGKRNKEQTALMDYGVFSVTSTGNRFNRYREYQNRIESLLTSIDIVLKLKSSIDPTLVHTFSPVSAYRFSSFVDDVAEMFPVKNANI